MKNITVLVLICMCSITLTHAQKYLTRTGSISFFSATPLENIEAYNNQVSGVIDLENGGMAFTLLMKAFTFEKALMQEHFNEKYVESHLYPKASFKGNIKDFDSFKLGSKPADIIVSGKLSIHGVTKDVSIPATLMKDKNGNIEGKAAFIIDIQEYEIKVPSAVRKNIADNIEIKVNMVYEEM
ncbi:YceI family protein [Saccharicrinis sp. 156]|uniref:YceI family protein n=1 Tax=Saccharicrinis sp. 156 TaxID=3417574 RepID=UPI003D3276C8